MVILRKAPAGMPGLPLGADLGGDPQMRAAADLARDSAMPALTQGVIGNRAEPGRRLMLLAPVYVGGAAHQAVDQRRAALRGWAMLAMDSQAAIQKMVGPPRPEIHLEVHDGSEPGRDSLLFSSGRMPEAARQIRSVAIEVPGRLWTLVLCPTPEMAKTSPQDEPFLVLIGGAAGTFAATALGFILLTARARDSMELAAARRERFDAERRYRRLVETTQVIAWEMDFANFRFTYVAPSAEGLLGYPVGEWYRAGFWSDHIHPEDRAWATELCIAASVRGENHELEYRMIAEDGRTVWVKDLVTVHMEGGKPRTLSGAMIDLTAAKELEIEIRRERDLSRAAIDSLPGLFYLLGEDGRFRLWNRNLETATRYTADEIAGMKLIDLIDPPDRPAMERKFAEVLAGEPGEAMATVRTKDNRRLGVHFTCRRLALNGESRLIGTGLDVTEVERARDALAVKTKELERSNAELEQFAYVASHDLREPLRMVTSYLQLLERRYADKLDATAKEFIGFATDGAARMDRLILDLLEFSRVGRLGKPFAPADTGKIAQLVLDTLSVSIHEAGAGVSIMGHFPIIAVDDDEIARLYQNLIANALKYRDPRRAPDIKLGCERMGRDWHFWVADNGIGIPEKDFERVFMLFQRLHQRAQYAGTGIGLAICKKIVERHGGRIWVESLPGQGSRFHFTLPER